MRAHCLTLWVVVAVVGCKQAAEPPAPPPPVAPEAVALPPQARMVETVTGGADAGAATSERHAEVASPSDTAEVEFTGVSLRAVKVPTRPPIEGLR